MAFQHHNEGMSPEMRKLFEDQQSAQQRFEDQVAGRAKRAYPDGRLGATDDGELAFAIGPHPEQELVMLDFGKPVEYIAMPPQQAVELAQNLIKHARAISTEPIRVVLH